MNDSVRLGRIRHTFSGTAGIVRLVRPVWLGLGLVVVASIACLAVGGYAARAAGSPADTSLAIQPLTPVELGTPATVMVRLTTATGIPIENETVSLDLDGVHRTRATTDLQGYASFTIPGTLEAGTHPLVAAFEGTSTLARTITRLNLIVVPATIEIQTVPAMAGIEFSLDGHPFASDAEGIARYTVTRVGLYQLKLVSDATTAPNARFTFSRWGDGVYVPERQVRVPSKTRFRVGFNISYLTNLTFVDTANQPVAPGRISSITIRSPHRQVYTFDHVQPEWLPAATVLQDGNGLKTTPITYSVDEVIVDGVTVVDRGQQHFELSAPSAPRISLKLYSVHLHGHDAFYGIPLGTGAYLQHPDGFVEYQPFDANDIATFTALPIASYRTGVIGGPGLSRARIFDLAPGQTVPLSVISYLDVATAVAAGGFLALVVLISVPSRLRRRARRQAPETLDIAQPAWHRPYAVRFGYLSLGGLLALGFVLTLRQAPGIGSPANDASAATVVIARTGTPVASAGVPGAASPSATPEPTAQPPAQVDISPTFYTVWRRNGGGSTFGTVLGAAFEEPDATTGQQITVQYFARARLEYHPEDAGTPYQVQVGRLGIEEAQRRGLINTEPFKPLSASVVLSTPDCEYYAETGHQLCGRFRDYWHSHGLKLGDAGTVSNRESLALLGYPISEEFIDPDSGLTVQYFERARLEYNPAQAGTANEVVAGNLNVEPP